MSVAIALPPSKRDLRLDLFRGLANWAMFLGHIPSTVLAWLTFRNYGFSDGADLFVFIAGYTSAIVYTRKMSERGFIFGTTRLFRRVWQIYVAHVFLFVCYLATVHFLSHRFNIPDFIDRFNVAPLTDAPVETLIQGLLLRYKWDQSCSGSPPGNLAGTFPPIHRGFGISTRSRGNFSLCSARGWRWAEPLRCIS